jgi:hypothetical protein
MAPMIARLLKRTSLATAVGLIQDLHRVLVIT